MPVSHVYPFIKFDNGIIRPWVPVIIENTETGVMIRQMALLDTGADACCFPKFVASQTGYKLKEGDEFSTRGVDGKETKTWKHNFRIHLLNPKDLTKVVYKTRKIAVDCVANSNIPPILGAMDFMIKFNVRFHYKTKNIVIELP